MSMALELKVAEVRATVLNYPLYRGMEHSLLNELFHFPRTERRFSAPDVLADCFFYDIGIRPPTDSYLPPESGAFETIFPLVLRRLLRSSRLTLFVKSYDRDYFDEFAVIEDLARRRLRYVLLPDLGNPQDPRAELDRGNLIFEWPPDSLTSIVEKWFMSPTVSVEGYVAPSIPLVEITHLYFDPDTEERIRKLLRFVDFAFRVWTDNDGLFLATDKLRLDEVTSLLHVQDLNRTLAQLPPQDV
jgi:hypothetical protein